MIKEKYFKIYSNCKIIDGHSKSAIYDLQRSILYNIPKDLSSILKKYNECKIQKIYQEYNTLEDETLDEYFKFLISKDIIFLSDSNSNFINFPKIDFSYNSPFLLRSIIVSLTSNKDWKKLSENIILNSKSVNCKRIQLRFDNLFDYKTLKKVISFYNNHFFYTSISIIISNNLFEELIEKKELLEMPLIDTIIYYGKLESLNSEDLLKIKNVQLVFFDSVDFPRFKKNNNVRFSSFNPNIEVFSESLKHNIYYNQKVFITSNGNVFQSPFVEIVKGNIFESNLREIVNNNKFKEYWNISKDLIKVCRDCEFRYICNDGRIPQKITDTEYYFEEDCEYDPFIT